MFQHDDAKTRRPTRNRIILGLAIAFGMFLPPAVARAADLPPLHIQGKLIYVSGGSVRSEAKAMRRAAHNYPLELRFLRRDRNGQEQPLSGDAVTILDHAGRIVLRTRSEGPILLARLPPGRYMVVAEDRGQVQQRDVHLARTGHEQVVFTW